MAFAKKARRSGALAALLAAALVATGCSASPPGDLEGPAKALGGQIEDGRKALDKAKKDYEKKLNLPQYRFMKQYEKEQQYLDKFTDADAKFDAAATINDKKIKPQLDDWGGNRAQFENDLARAKTLLSNAKTLITQPAQWADKVASVKADPSGTIKQSATALQVINTDYGPLNKQVDAAKVTYKQNADAIGSAFVPISALRSDALRANGLLQAEVNKAQPNWAVAATQADIVQAKVASYNKDGGAFKSKLGQLDVRETWTLVDARVDSWVIVYRTSWDEDKDGNTEKNHTYDKRPRKGLLDVETANYFAQFGGDDVLAKLQPGTWGGVDFKYVKVDEAQWKKLGIDAKEDLPKGHNAAEFTIELDQRYCHQVLVYRNGKPGTKSPGKGGGCAQYNTTADTAQGKYWVESSELRTDLIGMDLYAKPFGELPEQAATNGVPPGITYVGDESTGEWREDDDGKFWVFYGQYRLFQDLIGGPSPYYYRSDWDDWGNHRRSKAPYFGSLNGKPRFGAKSPFASSRPFGSFYTNNLHGTTVRSAGPSARGGGPGAGGK